MDLLKVFFVNDMSLTSTKNYIADQKFVFFFIGVTISMEKHWSLFFVLFLVLFINKCAMY